MFWADPINTIFDSLLLSLTSMGMSGSLARTLLWLVGIILMITLIMVFDIMLVWIERKVVARFQGRLGPNRVGPFGIFQPFPDIIKLITKEDTTPEGADKVVFNLAPIISLGSVLFLWAIVPLAVNIYGVDLNVALLYLVAAGALGTLSVIMAGWSSNNKYAVIGAFRQVAAMISFEVPMIVALLIPAIFTGSLSMSTISTFQAENYWFFLVSPLGAILFLIAAIAELGRSPFDLNEGESEIVSGYHIEYSGMKFGLFYAGELLHAFTFGGFLSVLFFGGWHGPFATEFPILGVFYFMIKAMIGYWIIMWVKYTVPRIRIDHMLMFNWKFLTPVAFALLIATAVFHPLLSGLATWAYVLGMFLVNVILAWSVVEIMRSKSKKEQAAASASAPAAH